MTPKMAKALEASIKKWQGKARVKTLNNVRLGCESCPLCAACGDTPESFPDCTLCPVMKRTGYSKCQGSPYVDAAKAFGDGNLKAFKKAASKEVEFLKSLREPAS